MTNNYKMSTQQFTVSDVFNIVMFNVQGSSFRKVLIYIQEIAASIPDKDTG